jgi:hypothetical protein
MAHIEYSVLYTGLQLIRVECMITTTGHCYDFAVLQCRLRSVIPNLVLFG